MIYGNKFRNNTETLDEAVVDDIKKNLANIKDLKDQWKKSTKSFVEHKWIYRYINESQKAKISSYYQKLCEEEISYSDYKRYFSHICKFMGIPNTGVIIENLVFRKDDKDKDQDIIAVQYSKGTVKVKIPDGVRLIHVSPADNIQELIPSFRSKFTGRYLYPSKRCFFTVAKEIKPTQARLEGQKLTRYTPKDKYTEAYIDPTYTKYKDRSVYIETLKPIPVVKFYKLMEQIFGKIKDTILGKDRKTKEEIEQENTMIRNMYGSYFVENNVTDIEEEDYFDPLIEGSLEDELELIKKWKTSNEANRIKKFKSTSLSEEEYNQMKDCIERMRTEEKYQNYKKAFDEFCKFCHIVPDGVIIKTYTLSKNKDGDTYTLEVDYSENTKKITLPEGTELYHLSKVDGIKELIPQFRGKSAKGYLYDKPRVYLTIRKNMPKFLADYKANETVYKYKVTQPIREVYVDPLVYTNLQGAVYVETNTPIPVEELKQENIVKKVVSTVTGQNREEPKNESFDFDEFYEFVTEFGMIPVDEE